MKQLDLFSHFDELSLTTYLEKSVPKNITIVLTDNSTIMMSFKTSGNSVSLRLHRMFLSAGREVIDELVDYIKNKSEKTPLIRNFINKNTHTLKKKPLRNITCLHRGKRFNLLEIFNKVNSEYFDSTISSSITWSTRRPKMSVAKRTLGSYSQDMDLIRISPVLDSTRVPAYFLEFVVYHEMLHAFLKNEPCNGKRTVHTGKFKRHEKLFRLYDRAMTWEKKRWG